MRQAGGQFSQKFSALEIRRTQVTKGCNLLISPLLKNNGGQSTAVCPLVLMALPSVLWICLSEDLLQGKPGTLSRQSGHPSYNALYLGWEQPHVGPTEQLVRRKGLMGSGKEPRMISQAAQGSLISDFLGR